MYTFQAIQIFLFLIPGFMAAKILDTLVIRRQTQKELESMIEALIFSMIIYTVYSFSGEISPITLDQTNNSFAYNYDARSFMILVGIGILLPVLLAFIINNDLHMKLARVLKITKKTARLSVWHDTFYDKKPMVVLDFSDGRRLFGWVEHYSDDPDKPFLYVAKPQWIDGENYVETGLEGMLITPEQKISFIEFLKEEIDGDSEAIKPVPQIKKGEQNGR